MFDYSIFSRLAKGGYCSLDLSSVSTLNSWEFAEKSKSLLKGLLCYPRSVSKVELKVVLELLEVSKLIRLI